MISEQEILNAGILIVDDHRPSVLMLEDMLRECGYVCISATTDSHAVCELHRENRYDLILLDLKMPGMDGMQVMEELKEIEADNYLPVIVISAMLDQKLQALGVGAKDFVAKPFNMAEVKMRIRNMLEVRLLHKQLERSNLVLESLALHDPLTGLPNRRLLMDRLSLSIVHARRNGLPMAVMYLDLDDFKLINDTLGHAAGDILLHMVAARLMAAVRQEDTVARLGGDEYVIALWEYSNDDDLAKLAAKVLQAVSQPYDIDGHSVSITSSVGVGIYPIHGDDAEKLIRNADLALYEAKRNGKNDYHIAASTDPANSAR